MNYTTPQMTNVLPCTEIEFSVKGIVELLPETGIC